MAIDSRSALPYLQRAGILEPVMVSPVRRLSFRELAVNAKRVFVDEALPAEMLNAERVIQSDRMTGRDWRILGTVVVTSEGS